MLAILTISSEKKIYHDYNDDDNDGEDDDNDGEDDDNDDDNDDNDDDDDFEMPAESRFEVGVRGTPSSGMQYLHLKLHLLDRRHHGDDNVEDGDDDHFFSEYQLPSFGKIMVFLAFLKLRA